MDSYLLNNISILTCPTQIIDHAPLTIPLKMNCCTKPDSERRKIKKIYSIKAFTVNLENMVQSFLLNKSIIIHKITVDKINLLVKNIIHYSCSLNK